MSNSVTMSDPSLHRGAELPAEPTSIRWEQRALVAAIVAGLATWYLIRLARVMPNYGTDFDPIRYGAKLWLRGEDPYATIGPGLAHWWNYRLRYPPTALLLALPFSAIPILIARAIFVSLTSGALAFFLSKRSYWPLFVFASASWWAAVGLGQWSPAMFAATLAPALGIVLAAKPNLGLVALAGMRDRRSLIIAATGAAVVFIVMLALEPRWFTQWRAIVRNTPDVRPLALSWIGSPLLLAAFKWRRPEARMLLAFAIVPLNPALYEGVLLFMIPRTALQGASLAVASWLVEPLAALWMPKALSVVPYDVSARIVGQAMLVCMCLPALVMVLRRPNVAKACESVAEVSNS